jgi:glycine cleavage system H protein
MNIPENLYYSNEHEWVRVEGENAYIGITDFAQEHLGDIVFVELPEPDTDVSAGEQVGVIESVKAVSSMFSRSAVPLQRLMKRWKIPRNY